MTSLEGRPQQSGEQLNTEAIEHLRGMDKLDVRAKINEMLTDAELQKLSGEDSDKEYDGIVSRAIIFLQNGTCNTIEDALIGATARQLAGTDKIATPVFVADREGRVVTTATTESEALRKAREELDGQSKK